MLKHNRNIQVLRDLSVPILQRATLLSIWLETTYFCDNFIESKKMQNGHNILKWKQYKDNEQPNCFLLQKIVCCIRNK